MLAVGGVDETAAAVEAEAATEIGNETMTKAKIP